MGGAPWPYGPKPARLPPPLVGGAGGPRRAAPGGPPLRERKFSSEVIGILDGEGFDVQEGPCFRALLGVSRRGAGDISKSDKLYTRYAPCRQVSKGPPPRRGAILQHLLPSDLAGHVLQLWTLTTSYPR